MEAAVLTNRMARRHPLAVLASHKPWPQIESSLAPVFAHRDRKGWLSQGADVFGPTLTEP